MNRLRLISVAILTVVCFAGCQQRASDTHAADEAAIRAADATTLKAAQAKDVDRAISNYAEDAVWLPPNAPSAQGKQAIRAGWSQLLSIPGLSIDWHIEKVDVSRSGDLAYTYYKYQMTIPGQGKTMTDHGKDLAVWKKQGDGSWKMVADTFNSDLPAIPSAP